MVYQVLQQTLGHRHSFSWYKTMGNIWLGI